MVSKEQVVDLIKEYEELRDNAKKTLKEYVQNKDNPLEDRCHLFSTCDLPDDEDFIVHFESFDLPLDDYRRYEVIDLVYQIEYLEECLIDQYIKISREDIDNLKEEIFSKFIKSFQLDW